MKSLDNLGGMVFNKLTIIEELPRGKKPSGQVFRRVLCKCECGGYCETTLYSVTSGKKTNCGSCTNSFTSFNGELGKVYGRLTVKGLDIELSKRAQSARVVVECTCGTVKTVVLDSLKRGQILSCGCYNRELAAKVGKSKLTHGLSKTPEYQTWIRMKGRCYNKNNLDYPEYGGRGIVVCDRWKNSFENFLEDMGLRPPGLELDRINPDHNYSPENCRWATEQIQSWNRRRMKRNKSGKEGVTFNKSSGKWEARISYCGKEMCLGLFDDIEKAVEVREQAEVRYYGGVKNPYSPQNTESDV